MATQFNRGGNRPNPDIRDCEERDNATQLSINIIKKVYCQKLKEDDSNIQTLKIGYEANRMIYKNKERRFLATSDNYQRYLNTEISMGTQLVQANEKIKTSVANFKNWDDNISKNLKDLFDAVKVAKTKMSELRDAATKLHHSKHDSCYASQWNLVTGKVEKEEKQDQPGQQNMPQQDPCEEIDEIIHDVLHMPRALSLDADSVFKSSSDLIGIQKFCNIGSLVPLQLTLYNNADAFDKHLLETIKTRKTDLDARQDELKTALKNRTGFVMDLYTLRDDYASVHNTLEKICCPKCHCVNEEAGNCEPRLDQCERKICDICGELCSPVIEPTPTDDSPTPPEPNPNF